MFPNPDCGVIGSSPAEDENISKRILNTSLQIKPHCLNFSIIMGIFTVSQVL